MKKQDSGQDQLQRICDLLRRDTLEPALAEARRIESEAQQHAQRVLEEAHRRASERESQLREHLKQEQEHFQQNVKGAMRQAIELLRQEVEEKLFKPTLDELLSAPSRSSQWVAQMLTAMVKAVEREGIQTRFEAVLGQDVDQSEVEALLKAPLKGILSEAMTVGHFQGGIQLRLTDAHLTLDISDVALKELFGRFLRKDFRDLLFG